MENGHQHLFSVILRLVESGDGAANKDHDKLIKDTLQLFLVEWQQQQETFSQFGNDNDDIDMKTKTRSLFFRVVSGAEHDHKKTVHKEGCVQLGLKFLHLVECACALMDLFAKVISC